MEKKKQIPIDIEKPQNEEIKDKYYVVFILFLLTGIIHVLPQTFFVTAHDYWMYKFRDTTKDEVDSDHRTTLQTNFAAAQTIATHVANVTGSFIILFFGKKLSINFRLFGSLVGVLVLYIFSAAFIYIDTDSWQTGFFVLTMFIVAGISGTSIVFGLTFFSIVSSFPTNCIEPYINGQGLSPVFTALLQVLCLGVGISTTGSAQLYFWIAIGMIVFGLIYMVMVIRYNHFYNHYSVLKKDQKRKKAMKPKEFFSTLKTIWKYPTNFFFYLCTVYTTHPSITSLVVSEGKGEGEWNDTYFVPITTFFIAGAGEYIGRLITLKFRQFSEVDGIWYLIFSAARVVIFVPLIMLCNAQPRTYLPVVFPHDYQYILIMITFSISNGILMSILYLLIAKNVPAEKLEDAYEVNLVVAQVLMGSLSVLGFVFVDLL